MKFYTKKIKIEMDTILLLPNIEKYSDRIEITLIRNSKKEIFNTNWLCYSILSNRFCDHYLIQKDDIVVISQKNDEYKLPKKILDSTYGVIYYFPTENVVCKRFKSTDNTILRDMLKEISIYSLLKKHDITPKFFGFDSYKNEIYMEKGDMTLYEYFESSQINLNRTFLEIVKHLKIASKYGLIHCDLKPQNIMIINDKPKIIDWGLAEVDNKNREKSTNIQTLWYRSPEILLANIKKKEYIRYTNKVDIFSLGLIFLQGYTKTIIRGKTDTEQALLYLKFFFEKKSLDYLNNYVTGESVYDILKNKLIEIINPEGKEKSMDFIDLLSNMLQFNPKHRFSYKQVLKHPYFNSDIEFCIPKTKIYCDKKIIALTQEIFEKSLLKTDHKCSDSLKDMQVKSLVLLKKIKDVNINTILACCSLIFKLYEDTDIYFNEYITENVLQKNERLVLFSLKGQLL